MTSILHRVLLVTGALAVVAVSRLAVATTLAPPNVSGHYMIGLDPTSQYDKVANTNVGYNNLGLHDNVPYDYASNGLEISGSAIGTLFTSYSPSTVRIEPGACSLTATGQGIGPGVTVFPTLYMDMTAGFNYVGRNGVLFTAADFEFHGTVGPGDSINYSFTASFDTGLPSNQTVLLATNTFSTPGPFSGHFSGALPPLDLSAFNIPNPLSLVAVLSVGIHKDGTGTSSFFVDDPGITASVPEPGTIVLLVVGIGTLAGAVRVKRTAPRD